MLTINTIAINRQLIRKLSDSRAAVINHLLSVYEDRVRAGLLREDEHQHVVVDHLDHLNVKLFDYQQTIRHRNSFLNKLFKKSNSGGRVRGLYLHGSVGCGKTMLMDLFYDNCCVDPGARRRVHFHSFMIDFHTRLHRLKKEHKSSDRAFNPIASVAQSIRDESWLLCLDEFQVTDIGDAMILKLLFEQLFATGIVMIATSNRPPDDLYRNGLQRSNFLPFIPILKENCYVLPLDSGIDYRQRSLPSDKQVYYLFEDDADKHLDRLFKLIASRENDTIRPKTLTIKERNVTFANTCGRVCDSTFQELCDRPLGAIDYLTMSLVFHTVIIRNIPQMSLSKKTQCRRFITLIDTFYDNKVRVLFSAQVPPNQLFLTSEVADHHMDDDNRKLMDDLDIKFGTEHSKANLFSGEEEVFAFERTISRMTEMQTKEYWNSNPSAALSGSTNEWSGSGLGGGGAEPGVTFEFTDSTPGAHGVCGACRLSYSKSSSSKPGASVYRTLFLPLFLALVLIGASGSPNLPVLCLSPRCRKPKLTRRKSSSDS
ncbi:unnamed protein product [Oppiella nova]|uniref:AFG1-like ATPase n=1 Tax=Oppiella nova TaxID=334625 RepID=A0A7R9LCB0_9ACAR|nr:unnamed protein product [Oppiella nova]CAG2162137.1 unnamed protein product [Oppiella nova]